MRWITKLLVGIIFMCITAQVCSILYVILMDNVSPFQTWISIVCLSGIANLLAIGCSDWLIRMHKK